MRQISLLLFVTLLLNACSNKNSNNNQNLFELKGKLMNSSGEDIYLEKMSPKGLAIIDTAVINENGEFIFNTIKPELGFYKLKISDRNFATLILDSIQKVMVTGNAKDLGNTFNVEGSADSKLFWELNEISKNSYKQRDSLSRLYQAYANSMKMDAKKMDSLSLAIEAPYNAITEKQNNYLTHFIDLHPTSLASLAAIQQLAPENYLSYYIKLDQAMMSKYPNSQYVTFFHEKLEPLKRLQIGALAPDFTLNNVEGKPVALSSLKGKVVLIDFWASWCAPCRAETPNLAKLYAKYKNKNFEIFSVSLDKEKDKWTDAIKKDKLNWTNVNDPALWDSKVVKLYNFNSIPTTYLIDKAGKIICSNLRGEELEKKLEDVCK